MRTGTAGLATALLLAGCGQPPPPPPPGATIEQLRAVSEAADAVRKDHRKLEERLAALEARLQELARENDALREGAALRKQHDARLEEMAATIKEQSWAIVRLSKGVAPVPPGMEPAPDVPPPPPLKGQVLAADSGMDVYLVSVGKKDGVKTGDELTVYRGDSFVAVVIVDSVFEDKASVTVKKVHGKPMLKSPIKTGDKVASGL